MSDASADPTAPLGRDAFAAKLRTEGARSYHDRHPFHVRMHAGALSPVEVRSWVANRYYYQTRIPIKDALILSKSDDPAFRRRWIRRIVDHDGRCDGEGGLAEWLELARGVGLDVEEVRSCRHVLPATRFACDAYVALVRERSLVEAVASSLTELFSPSVMARRIEALQEHYPWIDRAALAYFRGRLLRAPVDAREALDHVLTHATTREAQERCVDALVTKANVLWALLDAIERGPREPWITASEAAAKDSATPSGLGPLEGRALGANASEAAP